MQLTVGYPGPQDEEALLRLRHGGVSPATLADVQPVASAAQLMAVRAEVDAVTVSDLLNKRGELGRVGGGSYLHTLIASVPTAANAGYYARIVRERAILRRLVEVGTRIVQLGYTGDGSEIGVFFHSPPPARSNARAPKPPTFVRYDRQRRLSTSLTLPCAGTGTVWFSPFPAVPPSISASVPVQFVSQS